MAQCCVNNTWCRTEGRGYCQIQAHVHRQIRLWRKMKIPNPQSVCWICFFIISRLDGCLWISSERMLLFWDGWTGLPLRTETASYSFNSNMNEALMESSAEADSLRLSNSQAIQLKPQSSCSPCGSPRMSPCGSPRNSPRHSPLLFRKLLMSRSIALQRCFTLAHTPR